MSKQGKDETRTPARIVGADPVVCGSDQRGRGSHLADLHHAAYQIGRAQNPLQKQQRVQRWCRIAKELLR